MNNPSERVILMLVDDEPSVLKSLERLFIDEGRITTVSFTNPEEALGYIEANEVGIIISDERMPGLSGSDFLTRVKRSHPDILRIILTGQANQSSTIRAINDAGVFRYLTKPWNNLELHAVIIDALDYLASISLKTSIGKELANQKHKLAQMNQSLLQDAQNQKEKLERSLAALRQMSDARLTHRSQCLGIMVAMTALHDPPLVQLGRDIVESLRRAAPGLGLPPTPDLLDAGLLAGLLSDSAGALTGYIGKLDGFAPVIELLDAMKENVNATGPQGKKLDQIPPGARLLRIAHDFHKFNLRFPGSGQLQLAKESYRMYDFSMVEVFRTLGIPNPETPVA